MNYIAYFSFGIITMLSIWLSSCQQFKNPELLPAYITLDTFKLETRPNQGSASHDIKEVYLYMGVQFLGGYRAHAPFPVLGEGKQLITLFAGIRQDLIQDRLDIYPFYERFTQEVDFAQGGQYKISPVFRYLPNAKFSFIEDFESTNIFSFRLAGPQDARVHLERNTVFEGEFSGRITVSKENPFVAFGTSEIYYDLPRNGTAIYLEMDYKSDTFLSLGLKGYQSETEPLEDYYKIIINPSKEWRKAYIKFTDEVLALRRNGYRIILGVEYDPRNNADEQHIYLDNLKLVHF